MKSEIKVTRGFDMGSEETIISGQKVAEWMIGWIGTAPKPGGIGKFEGCWGLPGLGLDL